MHGAIEELSAVDLSEVREAVGSRSFGRGRSYERNQRVVAIEWDPRDLTLTGSVAGTAFYTTTAYFADADGSLAFEDGECTCPVGYNCKHVAAIVIAAAGERAGAQSARLGLGARPAAIDAPAWERSLRALIDTPAAPAGGRPLAIELSLRSGGAAGGSRLRLMARLMRPGARGGWVNGSLSWGRLDSWQVREGEYRSDHLALVRELYAIYRAREQRAGYYYGYGYGDDRTLDLSDCDSPQLWSLLDEATRIELRLIHALAGLGDLPPYERGELLVDVRRDGKRGSLVTGVLRLGGDDAAGLEPLLFLGPSGHGVVCAERDEGTGDQDLEHRLLRLVRLATAAPPQLQRMVLGGDRLEVPAGALERFAVEICPALRHVATVSSSDGSFTPPEISGPTLVLRASYGAEHAVELDWAWAYRIGSQIQHVPLGIGAAGPGFRDRGAERAILAETVLTETGLERHGLLDAAARPAETPAVALAGIETMRLTTEVLPRLEERGVAVEVAGEPAEYRDVGESLTIGVSTTEVAGERDWFDLGVTISVEGRELRFADVFVALASGESHLLLDDGAHLSLREAPAGVVAAADRRRHRRSPIHRRRRCGSAATRPGCGPNSPRSASSPSRPRPGGAKSARSSTSTRSPSTTRRPGWTPTCVRTSATVSAGWRRCGDWSSAASSPTTWDSARPCRRWRCSATLASAIPASVRSWSSLRRASSRTGWAKRRGSPPSSRSAPPPTR